MANERHYERELERLTREVIVLKGALALERRKMHLLEKENVALHQARCALRREMKQKDDDISFYFISS